MRRWRGLPLEHRRLCPASAGTVEVGCPDCHVPQCNWITEVGVKFKAAGELYYFLTGQIATDEQFGKVRPELAKQVFANFYAADARECRHCHDYNNMILEDQTTAVRFVHPIAMQTDANCLDCHKELTHKNFESRGYR
jgi:cytochrome c-type protein NapC